MNPMRQKNIMHMAHLRECFAASCHNIFNSNLRNVYHGNNWVVMHGLTVFLNICYILLRLRNG